jgi:choline dehydrogenase-like flavoprotein
MGSIDTNSVNGHTSGTNGTNGVNGHHLSAHISADDFTKQDFDYVICGGGTAGLTVAARLSEDPNVKVGIIEAGKLRLDDPLVDIPTMFLQMLGNPDYDWMYKTVPQVSLGGERLQFMTLTDLAGCQQG